LTIRSTNGNDSVAVLPAWTIGNGQQATDGRLIFNRYGNQYVLAQIWMAGEGLGRGLRVKVSKSEAARNSRPNRTEIMVVSR
jgi:hypothetical protein